MLDIDNAVSGRWGRMSAIRPVLAIDGLLAATALTNGLTLVTRNDPDVAGPGATVPTRSRTPKTTIDHNIAGVISLAFGWRATLSPQGEGWRSRRDSNPR